MPDLQRVEAGHAPEGLSLCTTNPKIVQLGDFGFENQTTIVPKQMVQVPVDRI